VIIHSFVALLDDLLGPSGLFEGSMAADKDLHVYDPEAGHELR
jgi:hypothetical protein